MPRPEKAQTVPPVVDDWGAIGLIRRPRAASIRSSAGAASQGINHRTELSTLDDGERSAAASNGP
jgi:hypothetical protein